MIGVREMGQRVKCLQCKCKGMSLILRSCGKQAWQFILVISVLERQRQVESQDSVASLCILMDKLLVNQRNYCKEKVGGPWGAKQVWPPHVHAYTYIPKTTSPVNVLLYYSQDIHLNFWVLYFQLQMSRLSSNQFTKIHSVDNERLYNLINLTTDNKEESKTNQK